MDEQPGRVVLVTGASRGIGRQLALDCGAHGMDVVVNHRSSHAAAEGVVAEVGRRGRRAVAVQADCTRESEVASMVGTALAEFGRIDCLINNAGVGTPVDLEHLTRERFEETLQHNLTSAFLVTQAVVPHMRAAGHGRLIFMSSVAARTGGMVSAAYAASKGGLEALMHYYATHLVRHGITANAVAPALIATDMVEAMPHPPAHTLPLGRLGRPDEVWPAVRMLIDSSYVTGQTIHVSTGMFMT